MKSNKINLKTIKYPDKTRHQIDDELLRIDKDKPRIKLDLYKLIYKVVSKNKDRDSFDIPMGPNPSLYDDIDTQEHLRCTRVIFKDLRNKRIIKFFSFAPEKTLELTKKTFIFSTYAKAWFLNGDTNDKRVILSALGSNQTIKSKKLFIRANKWLSRLKEGYIPLEEEFERFELNKKPLNKGQIAKLDEIISQWWRWAELNRRPNNAS